MPGITQQILLQHNKLQSHLDDLVLYQHDEAGSERAVALIANFCELMQRHLALEAHQLALRTLDVAAAQAYETYAQATCMRLDGLRQSVSSAPQQPLSIAGGKISSILAEHLALDTHKKLIGVA